MRKTKDFNSWNYDDTIEKTSRHNKGQFYTPQIWCNYAHKMINDQFGEDWKEKYVVWDCCCGSCNLTRDYYFKELYCSTLEQAELDIGKNYNTNSTKFQFDFLNESLDDLERKAPNLIEAFELDRPMVYELGFLKK